MMHVKSEVYIGLKIKLNDILFAITVQAKHVLLVVNYEGIFLLQGILHYKCF
jgi:hypothetical protein